MEKNVLKKFFIFCVLLFGLICWVYTAPQVFFSPQDHIATKLIDQINLVKKRIYAAIYMLTDKTIAQALINAKSRGVDVQIITDKSCLECEWGKINLLRENGIPVFVFKSNGTKNKYQNELMHHKFALLDTKVCTGSFNWTVSANKRNKENLIIVDDEAACKKYETQFGELKNICMQEKSISQKNPTNRQMSRVYRQLINKTVSFLKIIRDTLMAE